MYQGNWKCSGCGGTITELPFEPKSDKGLTCRACYAKKMNKDNTPAPEPHTSAEVPNDIPDDAELAGEPAPADDLGMGEIPATGEKPRFNGDWTCAGCGTAITSLPFSPRDTSNLKCLDCFKQSKN